MPTLGELLKERREARGVTLADISDATRIGSRFLKAIESDNFSALPGGIFTRSFIRAYARHIGMNEDEALGLYLQQVGALPEEQADAQTQQRTSREHLALPESRSRRPAILLIIAVIIIAAAVLAWLQFKVKESPPQEAPAPAQIAPSQPQPVPTAQPPDVKPPTRNTSPSGIVVRLDAIGGDCWIRYQIDDSNSASGMLKMGETKEFSEARQQVRLILGIRRNVELRINGRPAAFPPDTPNFSAQIVISRENLQTFFQ